MSQKPTGAGNSSFDLVDAETLFGELNLRDGQVVLDAGCGPGDYALVAARHVARSGTVYAIDLWEEGIEALKSAAEARGIDHLYARVADVTERIPLDDDEVDVALMVAVLHDLLRDKGHNAALAEVRRVLDPTGSFAVVEFRKLKGSPGPPVEVRLSPREVEDLLRPHGFSPVRTVEVGLFHYLSIFRQGPTA
jgi:ubiquinone/menaquinone biosynthesis C-methylase UbiE